MVKPIIRDVFFLGQKSEEATPCGAGSAGYIDSQP